MLGIKKMALPPLPKLEFNALHCTALPCTALHCTARRPSPHCPRCTYHILHSLPSPSALARLALWERSELWVGRLAAQRRSSPAAHFQLSLLPSSGARQGSERNAKKRRGNAVEKWTAFRRANKRGRVADPHTPTGYSEGVGGRRPLLLPSSVLGAWVRWRGDE